MRPRICGLEHRQVDQLCGAAHPRGQRRRAGVRAGEVVADLPADEYRCPVGRSAAEADDPARPRLQRELGGRTVRPRPVQPERRDRRDGQMRMDAVDLGGCERDVGHVEPRDHTTASASASSALTKSTSVSGSATTLCFEQARKLNSAPSSPGSISAPDADHRRSGSPSGGFDFDDLGAAVGEQLGAVGAGDPRGQVDDDIAVQRLRHAACATSFSCGSTCSAGSPAGTCCRCR